ncbi:ABC transporter ATP-binding protein [Pseudogemmobacter humi]|uniref:ABC transporter ATP-binding protein n=1 Tax=Pseudogemmobacter humi TaxID=2483812 RepID=UPI0013590F06|nr:ATP-binding cassette domain-containing protein [Pseudogemmobacter humi]
MQDIPLQLDQVSVRHGGATGRCVLDAVDLTLAPGERLCILGESGAGKTTLLELISGFRRPDAGRVRLFGMDPARAADSLRSRLRRQRMGFMFQDYALIEHLTAAANIALPLRLDGMAASAAHRHALERLADLGLSHLAAVSASALSGGEKQRVAFARATVHTPGLILADEPTGSLDPATGAEILRLILARDADAGRSVVVVTHNHAHCPHFDRVLVLRGGHLAEAGAPA